MWRVVSPDKDVVNYDVAAAGRVGEVDLAAGRYLGCRAGVLNREAAVAITLELYLEHQIIRGDFKEEPGHRPIDLLNSVAGGMIALTDAWSASLHEEAPPVWLDTVRVRRAQILMVIAQNTTPLPPRQPRYR